MSILSTSTKANSGILTVLVAIANTVGAAFAWPVLSIPVGADTVTAITAIVLWVFGLVTIYAPTIIATIANKKYTDSKTAQNIAGIEAGTAMSNGQVVRVENTTPPNPTNTGVVTEQPAKPSTSIFPIKSFDTIKFAQEVEELAKSTYLEANDINRFFAASDHGRIVEWDSEYDQNLYNDYLVNMALKAFQAKFGFPLAEAEQHLADDAGKPGGCAYYSVDNMARQKGIDFWNLLLMVRSTIDKATSQ